LLLPDRSTLHALDQSLCRIEGSRGHALPRILMCMPHHMRWQPRACRRLEDDQHCSCAWLASVGVAAIQALVKNAGRHRARHWRPDRRRRGDSCAPGAVLGPVPRCTHGPSFRTGSAQVRASVVPRTVPARVMHSQLDQQSDQTKVSSTAAVWDVCVAIGLQQACRAFQYEVPTPTLLVSCPAHATERRPSTLRVLCADMCSPAPPQS